MYEKSIVLYNTGRLLLFRLSQLGVQWEPPLTQNMPEVGRAGQHREAGPCVLCGGKHATGHEAGG